jgi:hypothetical protein
VFGVELSELICVKQRTYQNDDGKLRRFMGLYGSRRAAPPPPDLNCWRTTAVEKPMASASTRETFITVCSVPDVGCMISTEHISQEAIWPFVLK